jgi:hypothetical protein
MMAGVSITTAPARCIGSVSSVLATFVFVLLLSNTGLVFPVILSHTIKPSSVLVRIGLDTFPIVTIQLAVLLCPLLIKEPSNPFIVYTVINNADVASGASIRVTRIE